MLTEPTNLEVVIATYDTFTSNSRDIIELHYASIPPQPVSRVSSLMSAFVLVRIFFDVLNFTQTASSLEYGTSFLKYLY